MFFDHSNVRMAELCCNNRERNTFHCQPGSVGVAEAMKCNRRDFRGNTRRRQWALLIRCRPFPVTNFRE